MAILKIIVISCITYVCIFFAHAQVSFRLEDPKLAIERKKSAVVRIEVRSAKGAIISTGTGFFLTHEGHLITNKHVLKEYIQDSKNKISIFSSEGREFHKKYLGPCGDKRGIDLCLLQIEDTKVTSFLPPATEKIGSGNEVYTYGNCQGKFIKKAGKILETIKDFESLAGSTGDKINIKVETVRTSIAICAGDSGSPVFSQFGDLVGINTRNPKIEGKQYNIAITAKEILQFFEDSKSKNFYRIE